MNHDDARDLLEAFADLFDRDGDDPDPADVAELVGELADLLRPGAPEAVEVAGLLVEHLSVLDQHEARCAEPCGLALDELAGRLTGDAADVLAAAAALSRAGRAATAQDWTTAAQEAAGARVRLGPDVLPEGIGLAEHLLGEAAYQRAEFPLARRHWLVALAEYRAVEQADRAAVVAGGLADVAARAGDDLEAERYWREAADLFAAADDDEQAVEYARRSCRTALRGLREGADDADTGGPFRRARAARALALRHGLDVLATELLTCVAINGSDQGRPWTEVTDWFARNRTEVRRLTGVTDEQRALYLAGIDFAQGSAAATRQLPVEAEAALRAALPIFRAYGRATEAETTAALLARVALVFRDGGDVPKDPVPGGLPAAVHALMVESLAASTALERGDPAPARRCAAAIETYLATTGPTVFRGAVRGLEAVLGLLGAGLAAHDRGRAAAPAELERVEARLLATGSGMAAARVALQRGRLLLDLGDLVTAADVLLPAVLALDAVRFDLDGADRRREWSAVVRDGLAATYRALASLGRTRQLAELLEVVRANAVPVPVGSGGPPSLGSLLDPPVDPPGGTVAPIPGAALAGAGIDTARTVLARPARLRTPWGTLALEEALEEARRYTDPVRATDVVDWRVAEDRAVPPAELSELVDRFDLAARAGPVDPHLLVELAAAADEDALRALLGELHELYPGDDDAPARRYAAALTALGAHLDDESAHAVGVAVDARLAVLCADRGLWVEARVRAARAHPHVVDLPAGSGGTTLFPGILGDTASVLAGVAEHRGEWAAARPYWEQARDAYVRDEAWLLAAASAEGIADTWPRLHSAALDAWQEAADLYRRAGAPVEAGEAVARAAARLHETWPTFAAGDELAALRLADRLQALAHEHDRPVLAGHLGVLAAGLAAESTDSWDELVARYERSHAELTAHEDDPAQRRLALARLDMFAGFGAQLRDRAEDAEQRLAAALPELQWAASDPQVGTPEVAEEVLMCRHQLTAILQSRRGGLDDDPDAIPTGDSPDERANDLLRRAMIAAPARLADALALLADAEALAEQGDLPWKPPYIGAVSAWLQLAGHDAGPARAAVTRIQRFTAEHGGRGPRAGRVMLVAIHRHLAAELARFDGDPTARLEHLALGERELLALDVGEGAALFALHRAATLLQLGRAREALDTGLPALLALDAHRNVLPDAERRHRWSVVLTDATATVYRSAVACDDRHVVAELLEVTRANPPPVPRPIGARDDAVTALLLADPAPAAGTGSRSGAVTAGGGLERTALGLPPPLRTPWGTIALERATDAARAYRDPVRAGAPVDWRVHRPG